MRPALERALESEHGRRLLDRLFDELTSGHVRPDELSQAYGLLSIKAQRIAPEAFVQAVLDPRMRIFPIRKQGATVLADAPITARRNGDGSIEVELEARSLQYDEAHTLRGKWLRLGEDDVIGVSLNDAGGELRFGPALLLIQYSNEHEADVFLKGAEWAALGLTAGTGALAGTGARVTVLMWCDRVAIVLGTLLTLVDEHRGWILERFGERGRTFLRYADGVRGAIALYGLVRMATAVPQLFYGLWSQYRGLKETVRVGGANLTAEERQALDAIGGETEKLLREVETAKQEVKPVATSAVEAQSILERTRSLRAAGVRGDLSKLERDAATGRQPGAVGEVEAMERWMRQGIKGEEIELLPEVQNSGRSNPDFRVKGELVEVKTRGDALTPRYIEDQIGVANRQIRNSGLDVERLMVGVGQRGPQGSLEIQLQGAAARTGTLDVVEAQVFSAFTPNRVRSLRRVSIYRDGQLLGEWVRTVDNRVVRVFPAR